MYLAMAVHIASMIAIMYYHVVCRSAYVRTCVVVVL